MKPVILITIALGCGLVAAFGVYQQMDKAAAKAQVEKVKVVRGYKDGESGTAEGQRGQPTREVFLLESLRRDLEDALQETQQEVKQAVLSVSGDQQRDKKKRWWRR